MVKRNDVWNRRGPGCRLDQCDGPEAFEQEWVLLHLFDRIVVFSILALDDVEALGRAFFFANLARNASQPLGRVVPVKYQKRKIPRVFLR